MTVSAFAGFPLNRGESGSWLSWLVQGVRGTPAQRAYHNHITTLPRQRLLVIVRADHATVACGQATGRGQRGGHTAAAVNSSPAPTPRPTAALAASCLRGTWRVVSDRESPAVPRLVSGSELRQFGSNGIYTVFDSDAKFAFLDTTGVWNATITWRYTVHGQRLQFSYVDAKVTDPLANGGIVPLVFGSVLTAEFGCRANSLTLLGSGWSQQLTRQ